jgi:hypothetical protein
MDYSCRALRKDSDLEMAIKFIKLKLPSTPKTLENLNVHFCILGPLVKVALFTFTMSLFLACGKGKSSSEAQGDEFSTSKGDVSGILSDWSSNLFVGYQFLLQDLDSGSIFRAPLGESAGFRVTGVPLAKPYLAFMLNADFRFGWILQFANSSSTNSKERFQAFRFQSSGSLGSLVLDGKLIRSSNENSLVPIKTVTFRDSNANGIPDGLETEISSDNFATTKNSTGDLDGDSLPDIADADIDNDGLPNVLDPDVDNDGIMNVFDADSNQDSTPDLDKGWKESPTVSIPKLGFRHIYEQSTLNAEGEISTTLWFVFSTAERKNTAVEIVSGNIFTDGTYVTGEPFAGKLFDDGTHGDGLAGDGIWSAKVSLIKGKVVSSNQAFLFRVRSEAGEISEFLQLSGGSLSGDLTLSFSPEGKDIVTSWTGEANFLQKAGTSLQIQVLDSENKLVFLSERLLSTATSLKVPATYFTSGQSYRVLLHALASSPLSGFPGSAWTSRPSTYNHP